MASFASVSLDRPLAGGLREVPVPVGMTVAEAWALSSLGTPLESWPADQVVATVGRVRVPRSQWARVRPKVGTQVIFRPTVADDKFLRSALGFAAAIAALFVAPIIGAAIGGFFATSTGVALIGAAITVGGSLLVNALLPIRPPQINSDSGSQPKSLMMIGGSQNEARPWETVPQVLGVHRITPDYVARPYTFFSGQNQYMNFLFGLGYGRLSITQLKIGETPIAVYEEVDTEIREGVVGDARTTLYPIAANETTLSISLRNADGFVQRRTAVDADQISIDLVAAQGIFSYNSKTGAYDSRDVTILVQYRKVGDVAWTSRPNIVFTKTRDTFRRGDRWTVTRGQYDVRLQKATADYAGTGQVAEEVDWIALRSFTGGHPINFPKPLALVAMSIRATNQLNGIIANFNAVVEAYVKGFNGSTWSDDVLSNNPADLFRHVLQGPANSRPRTDDQLHLQSIEDWWQDCHDEGFTYNAIIADRRPVRDVLSDIAAAGRATVALRDGKWGVSFPRKTDAVTWHFNPRNMASFSTERIYRTLPHALRVRFIDQARGWRERERVVYADGYDASNATLYEQVEFPGVTDQNLVWRHGRFQIAQALLRPEKNTLGADVESLRVERGDKVEISNDVLLVGTGYGRVVSAASQVVTVDSRVIMEFGHSYQIRFQLSDGTRLTRTVLNTVEETQVVQLDPSDVDLSLPSPGDLFSFGETELVVRNYRVLEVHPGPDLSAQLLLVDDAPEIEDADTGTIPDYDPGITDPPDPYSLTPQSVTVAERLLGNGINTKSVVQVTVQIPRAGTIRAFEFQSKDVDSGGDYQPFAVVPAPHLVAESSDLEPGNWQFRVRALFTTGDNATTDHDYSAWVESAVTSLLGALAPPGSVENLTASSLGDKLTLAWDPVTTANLRNYVVKYSRATDGSASWGSSLEVATPLTNRIDLPTRSGTYLVKGITFAEIESVDAASIINYVEGQEANVVQAIDEDPLFPGTHVGTQAITGDVLTLTTGTDGLYVSEGTYYFDGSIDLGTVFTSRIQAVVEASGITIGDTMDTWPTLADLEALDNADPSLWGVQALYRWTNDDPAATGATWSDWTPFSILDVTARAMEFALQETGSVDGRISPGVTRLGVVVDMPDRNLGFKDQQSGTASGGFTILFDPPFKSLKSVTIITHDLNTTAGEKQEVVSKDASHVTIRFKNSVGTVIDRKFDIHALGYGLEVPLVT